MTLQMVAGNLAAIGSGGFIALTTSYIWPENYDFVATRAIGAHDMDEQPDEKIEPAAVSAVEEGQEEKKSTSTPEPSKVVSASTSSEDLAIPCQYISLA